MRAAFRDNFDNGIEVGASFCVVGDGETLVDLWGGYLDAQLERPWAVDSLVCIYSSIKGPAAAAVASLVQSGELDYAAPVSRYWPELRAARSGLTVSQLLSHQAGVCGVRETLSVSDLYDWDAMCRRLEREAPFWEPGTAAGYHAVTWGFLVGELVRRATGRTLPQVLDSRITGPLQADCHIGLPDDAEIRVAELIGPNRARGVAGSPAGERGDGSGPPAARESAEAPAPALLPIDAMATQNPLIGKARSRSQIAPAALNAIAMQNPLIRPYADACSAAWRHAELAASNGHANGRGLARIYGALAQGGVLNGVRILEPATVQALAHQVWGEDPDLVLGYPMRRGRGVNLNTRGELGPCPAAFGHTGTGGSLGFADPRARLGIGYAMNQLGGGTGPGSRAARLVAAVYDCLGNHSPAP